MLTRIGVRNNVYVVLRYLFLRFVFDCCGLGCRNVFPHTTFNWVGIDGTPVLCHMTPVGKFFIGWCSFSH